MLQQFPQHLREPIFFLVLHLFSGEAIVRPVYPRPDLGPTLLTLIEEMLRVYAKSLHDT
ncbi:hypothetical protein [Nocardia nepalensis]|uniref:hypothetical protein n=1 Tax=Nocardia nepalensis TaxID=3375448 RepID=UPI003B67E8CC